MAIDSALEQIREHLRRAADPRVAASMRRFFLEPVDFYGVPAPGIREIARRAYHEVKGWPLAQRNRLCRELWKSGKSEEGTVVVYLYQRFRSQCGVCEFRLFDQWIERYVTNWGHCDGVAAWLVAASIENKPGLAAELATWTVSKNRWKRRAAAVALVRSARKGRHSVLILEVAGRLLEDPDDLVRKGVGWLLKEAYTTTPREVAAFLRERKTRAPRLVLRIAAEKMTGRDRSRVLDP